VNTWIKKARTLFLFEGFRLMSPDEAALERAGWPRWRHSVRPVGALAWWFGVVANVLSGASGRDTSAWSYAGVATLCFFVVAACVGIGLFDVVRRRRTKASTPA
jgi:hypothetical protein